MDGLGIVINTHARIRFQDFAPLKNRPAPRARPVYYFKNPAKKAGFAQKSTVRANNAALRINESTVLFFYRIGLRFQTLISLVEQ
jgi:hypothetical protein